MDMSSKIDTSLIQINPTKSVAGAEFARGVQNFTWSIGSGQCMNLKKSYFLIKATVRCRNDQPVDARSGLALSYAAGACLYDSVDFLVGGKNVSGIKDNTVPQIHALRRRIGASGAYNQAQRALNFEDLDLGVRQKLLVNGDDVDDGYTYRRLGSNADASIEIKANGAVEGTVNLIPPSVGDILVVGGVDYIVKTVAGQNFTVIPAPAVAAAGLVEAHFKIKNRTGASSRYLVYRPEIGIFSVDDSNPDYQLYAGDYSIMLNPSSNYKKRFIEATFDGIVGVGAATAVANYDVNIDLVQFYASISKVNTDDSKRRTQKMILTECNIFSKAYTTGSLDFTVPASTFAVAVFVQDSKVGADNRNPPTMFTTQDGGHLTLRNIQLTYGNVTKPMVNYDSEYTPSAVDGLVQRWIDSMEAAALTGMDAGVEKYDQWLKSPFYLFSWDKDQNNRTTNLQLRVNYGTMAPTNNVYVACFYQNTVAIVSERGYILSVETLTS